MLSLVLMLKTRARDVLAIKDFIFAVKYCINFFI